MTQYNIDSCCGTTNFAGQDQINHYYTSVLMSSNQQQLPALSFTVALIDLLSPHSTSRGEELDGIQKGLGMSHGSAPTHYAVHGMPGVGKTQLALQFAQLSYSQRQYLLVFWILGEKLNQGFAKVLSGMCSTFGHYPSQEAKFLWTIWQYKEKFDSKQNLDATICSSTSQLWL